ncbi:hypothetical protein Mkiyose1665_27910 [Mycobacterium kiyosense]|uniref:Uncharacterized protein n=1 Tax=Mycobacterium kiyosense TaxID=2871094 RepID=A0A9P3Q6P1_9MYCO|nr:hypothetical protein IWGMT90018_17470 [Mycobacterium kiyosense]BDE13056.1 hypothetical protein MKCMC460_19160 [Mycobacterium sp. 20KCMC460]GLB82014.1 hypothetical protein SRL2020028_12700 [Mycobacterium kiyosense]GLB89525.1 hypothetical protein SRL2020130_23420 [Mycobacterium kiyosense]GLB95156.1 hypothetical protein SRL2020226_19320 [Mycobacterium kiyosense]
MIGGVSVGGPTGTVIGTGAGPEGALGCVKLQPAASAANEVTSIAPTMRPTHRFPVALIASALPT